MKHQLARRCGVVAAACLTALAAICMANGNRRSAQLQGNVSPVAETYIRLLRDKAKKTASPMLKQGYALRAIDVEHATTGLTGELSAEYARILEPALLYLREHSNRDFLKDRITTILDRSGASPIPGIAQTRQNFTEVLADFYYYLSGKPELYWDTKNTLARIFEKQPRMTILPTPSDVSSGELIGLILHDIHPAWISAVPREADRTWRGPHALFDHDIRHLLALWYPFGQVPPDALDFENALSRANLSDKLKNGIADVKKRRGRSFGGKTEDYLANRVQTGANSVEALRKVEGDLYAWKYGWDVVENGLRMLDEEGP